MIEIRNHLPRKDAFLGVVRAEGIRTDRLPGGFEERLADLLHRRREELPPEEEAVRQAVRDLLRNGTYKPTGRAKPASEYLIRAAREDGAFPRINAPVDVNNYVSLLTLLPASLWDLDLAGEETYRFRLGGPDEGYVFNAGGQVISVHDLVAGFTVDDGLERAIVNPVKDSLATKTTPETTRVAACIYAPVPAVSAEALQAVTRTFAELLAGCGGDVAVTSGIVGPGDSVRL